MSSRTELSQRIEDARRQLMGLPGVIGVGYGYKETSGESTKKLSLRVYVREKKSRSSLDPRDLVPAEVNGFRTDVVLPIKVRPAVCEDLTHHEQMLGGIRIGNLRQYLDNPGSGDLRAGTGTLGCICTLNNVGGRDNVGFLTCNHVLADSGGQNGHTVYQPNSGASNPRSGDLHPIGRVHNVGFQGHYDFAYPGEDARPFYIDCATAIINTKFSSWCDSNCGVKFDTRIRELDLGGDGVAGFERLHPADLIEGEDYVLYKVGATTGRTVGHVRDLEGTTEDPHTHEIQRNVLSMQYHGGNCGGGMSTAKGGDSGSAVVNSNRMVVAILHATEDILEITALCGHILPIQQRLNATVRNTGTGPSPVAGGGTLSVRGGIVLPPTPTRERAAALRERILFSRKGKDLYRLVDRHREEVLNLVNRSRPVTVAWHRNRGPDFLAHMAEAARDTAKRVPPELHGVELPGALGRVLDVLTRHGSGALKSDIDEHRRYFDYLAREVKDIERLAEVLLPENKVKAG